MAAKHLLDQQILEIAVPAAGVEAVELVEEAARLLPVAPAEVVDVQVGTVYGTVLPLLQVVPRHFEGRLRFAGARIDLVR